jgi:hypothetical protein
MSNEEKRPNDRPVETRDHYWRRCPKHGLDYPKGASCPMCDSEARRGAG